MNRNKLSWWDCMLVSLVVACSSSALAQESRSAVSSPAPGVSSVPAEEAKVTVPEIEAEAGTGSWMIGTRVTHFDLLDDTRGSQGQDSFMGSIYMLKDEQDHAPNKLFLQYCLVKSPFWTGVSYDHLRAAAWDDGGTDGTVDIEGFVPYVQARWVNETRMVPYVEVGLAFYKASFDESEDWSDGGRRTVDLDSNVMGREIAGGVAVRVYEGLSIDFYAQYMDVDDIEGSYSVDGGYSKDGDAIFTMSHVTYGIGAQYQF